MTQSLIELAEKLLTEAIDKEFDKQEWELSIERIVSHIDHLLENDENKSSDDLQKLVYACGLLNLKIWRIRNENAKKKLCPEYLDRSIRYFSLFIELNKTIKYVYYHRGDAYFQKWEMDKDLNWLELSIEDFTNAIESNCYIGDALINRGDAYVERGKLIKDMRSYNSAIEDYTELINSRNIPMEDFCFGLFPYWEKLDIGDELGGMIGGMMYDITINFKVFVAYFSRANAYCEKGRLLKDAGSLELSIKGYTKALALDNTVGLSGTIHRNRGTAYSELGELLKDPQYLDASIDDYTEAIKLNGCEVGPSYLGRGKAYFLKGVLMNPSFFKDAIQDFSIAIELDENNADAYYHRGLAYNYINQLNDYLSDHHVCQYLRPVDDDILIRIIPTIKEEAYNLFSLLEYFLDKNKATYRLLFDYIEVSEKLKDYLLVFKYIGFDASRLSFADARFQKALPILLYYLKGCVSSYRLYDEVIDDGKSVLSAQDYYYYVQSARQFSKDAKSIIGADAILQDAICQLEKRTSLPCVEKYYLGLLYYIRFIDELEENEKEIWKGKALDLFNQSSNLIWARRMIDILTNKDISQLDFNKYILKQCNEKKEINIDALVDNNMPEDLFLSQFSNYLHFNEVEDAFCDVYTKEMKTVLFANRVVFHEPLWVVFKLSKKSIHELVEIKLRINDEKILEEIIENDKVSPLTKEEYQSVEEDFSKFTDVTSGIDAEKKILDEMKNDLKYDEFYTIIRYLMEKKAIDKRQYYSLYLYYLAFVDDIKAEKNSRLVFNLLIGLVTPWYIGIVWTLVDYLISNGKKTKNSIRYSNYEEFKNNLWREADRLWRDATRRYYYESDSLIDNLWV